MRIENPCQDCGRFAPPHEKSGGVIPAATASGESPVAVFTQRKDTFPVAETRSDTSILLVATSREPGGSDESRNTPGGRMCHSPSHSTESAGASQSPNRTPTEFEQLATADIAIVIVPGRKSRTETGGEKDMWVSADEWETTTSSSIVTSAKTELVAVWHRGRGNPPPTKGMFRAKAEAPIIRGRTIAICRLASKLAPH